MIAATAYQGQNIGVFGLARSGLASVVALDAGGAHVFAWDDNENARKAAPFEVHDLYEMDFSILDGLVIAPGVPLSHPAPHALVKKARAANVPILGDIELFARSRDGIPSHDLVAITGTNGKSTTTALMSHVVHCSGRPAIAAGNIGTGVMGIEALTQDGVYVFELSSFQIELTHSLSADVAVLLNISPDHLDRHGDMEGYVNAKRRLFEMQKMDAVAVIGVDDDYGRSIAAGLPQRAVPISVETAVTGGVYVQDGMLMDAMDGVPHAVGRVDIYPNLPGRHNGQNMAAVYATGRLLGLTSDQILDGFASFAGLKHRLQLVGERDGVRFVNDSKATNTAAAAKALAAFSSIRWIAGGRFSEDDFSGLEGSLSGVRKAYLIGESAPRFAAFLEGTVPYEVLGTMDKAFAAADSEADEGDVVLLAPASKAFDQYPNFEVRGDHFVDLASQLIKEER